MQFNPTQKPHIARRCFVVIHSVDIRLFRLGAQYELYLMSRPTCCTRVTLLDRRLKHVCLVLSSRAICLLLPSGFFSLNKETNTLYEA
jgi:hypothetical protein